MKKILLFCVLFASVICASCSTEEDLQPLKKGQKIYNEFEEGTGGSGPMIPPTRVE